MATTDLTWPGRSRAPSHPQPGVALQVPQDIVEASGSPPRHDSDACFSDESYFAFSLERSDSPRQRHVGVAPVVGYLGREAVDHEHGQAVVGHGDGPLERGGGCQRRQHHDERSGRQAARYPTVVVDAVSCWLGGGQHLEESA